MDGFLSAFMEENDELRQRMIDMNDVGQPLDNEANDVPMYDQYNTGLAVTQNDMPRANLAIDPRAQPRCGVTGTIPSAEEGMMQGAMPQPRQLLVDMGQLSPEEQAVATSSQRKLKAGLNRSGSVLQNLAI